MERRQNDFFRIAIRWMASNLCFSLLSVFLAAAEKIRKFVVVMDVNHGDNIYLPLWFMPNGGIEREKMNWRPFYNRPFCWFSKVLARKAAKKIRKGPRSHFRNARFHTAWRNLIFPLPPSLSLSRPSSNVWGTFLEPVYKKFLLLLLSARAKVNLKAIYRLCAVFARLAVA